MLEVGSGINEAEVADSICIRSTRLVTLHVVRDTNDKVGGDPPLRLGSTLMGVKAEQADWRSRIFLMRPIELPFEISAVHRQINTFGQFARCTVVNIHINGIHVPESTLRSQTCSQNDASSTEPGG